MMKKNIILACIIIFSIISIFIWYSSVIVVDPTPVTSPNTGNKLNSPKPIQEKKPDFIFSKVEKIKNPVPSGSRVYFNVTVKNIGTAPYNGSIAVTEGDGSGDLSFIDGLKINEEKNTRVRLSNTFYTGGTDVNMKVKGIVLVIDPAKWIDELNKYNNVSESLNFEVLPKK